MGQSIWQYLVDKNHEKILNIVNSILGVHIPKAINFYVNKFNKKIANETEYSFITTVFGQKFPLSLFATKYP